MPTGYTYCVQTGEVTEFKDFAIRCARAMGALVTMRDERMDAAIPDGFKPSSYHADRLKEAKSKLNRLKAMSHADIDDACAKEHLQALLSWENWQSETLQEKKRYEDMLAKVRAWNPPNSDFAGFRKFMEEQLVDSMEHDLFALTLPKPMQVNNKEWYKNALAMAEKDIEYHQKKMNEETKRAKDRTEWIVTLKKSLGLKVGKNIYEA